MRKYQRPLWAAAVVFAAFALAACGSSSSSSSSSSSASSKTSSSSSSSAGKTGGTITLLYGTAPQSLDPGMDYTTQGAEINWIAYTGLVTYKHSNGIAGATLIPGLCTAMPTITDGGKTYSCTLRSGLVFSNGAPVKASDFTWAVQRNVKIPWGGSGQFVTPVIVGAQAFANGKAKTISGITTNDSTGQITIHLTAPYGPFMNVLAEPSMAPVPSGTPYTNQANNPPPGVGPYKVTNIVPNVSFTAVPNPYWAKMNIPGIPAAKVTVDAKISSNVAANALSVLNDSADIFDWADTIPGSLLPQIHAKAASRFRQVNLGGSTYYIFMNVKEKPFSSQLAREAVVTGLNEQAMNRLGSGTLAPACFFLPPAVPGHPSGSCPYGNPAAGGNIAKAKQLVQQSGMAGQPVTVWSETRSPRQQWMTYYTQFLNQIGFKATQKVLTDATYFTTLGELKLHPQTGFADWNMDFPNPIDFYGVLLDGHAILPANNENFGEVDDPYINAQVDKLSKVTDPAQLASGAQALDTYTAQKAYVAVFGYQTFPEFASDRINYGALVFHPLYGWDWTSFSLK
jgi:peptide/nickel transport system substrate-binding protein